MIQIEFPGFSLCLNNGKCIDLVNDYKCDCPYGYTGRNCQIFVDLDKFNDTDRQEQKRCELSNCGSKGGDGVCDAECNYFACGFDAGDCSAKGVPFSKCASASYCSHVFKDGHCDSICNNEECLFDGFDCSPSRRDCPSTIVDYCRAHGHDGFCDEQCNSPECDFDGGDCAGRKPPALLPGDISIVVLTTPEEFVKNVGLFLLTLSQKLRASIRMKSDEVGPLVFYWNGRPSSRRVVFKGDQNLSISYGGEIRIKRAYPDVGVLVWIEVDVAECYGECFTDVDIVANYLGAANAKKDLADMGMPIYEAIARHKTTDDVTISYSDGYWSFIIGCLAILIVVVTVFVLQQRTRKRRTIKAPCWIPPTEAQHKLSSMSQSEQMLRSSFFTDDLFPSKRPRIENLNYYKVCEYANPVKKGPPRITTLHKQASSNIPIQVEGVNVNVKGPFGRTALMMLCDNFEKPESQLIEEVDKIWAAGGDLNVQDDDEETAIFIAVRQGRLGLVKKLLDMGADPTIMNDNDSTCLHEAAANCNLSLVEELLRHNSVVKEDRTPYKIAEENEFRHLLELLDPDVKKSSVLLHIMANGNGKNNVKNSSRQVKRIPVKRRPQPLTPPHSDGCGSTPSPRAAFGAPSRPIASVLDSPSSDRTSNGNDESSPNSLPLALHSYWTSDVSHNSPPYETTELGICSYYNNYSISNSTYASQTLADVPYSSCQHSERSAYYSKQV
ncbi:notch domain protein [Cooperia oncophora]